MSETTDLPAANPLGGVFWMVVTGMQFVAVTALVKWLGTRIPAPQAAFLRYLIGLFFFLPVLRPLLRLRPGRRIWGLFAARGAAHT
ncbi:MAG: EamA family transporter, partial [Anaerolineae bacterium]|nr:EamA family transporter [Anaerolineae bacterium]